MVKADSGISSNSFRFYGYLGIKSKVNLPKLALSSLLLLLLPCSFSANAALSTTTANTIQGTAPYLTFNGGATKATTTAELLGITLSDGTKYTQTNSSTASNPIELPIAGQSMADVGMLIPTSVSSVTLSSLIGAPYNYWGDDDGDGQGIGGITATGTLNVAITDVNGTTVGRSDPFSACSSPYKVVLSSTAGNLTTQYGSPNVTPFSASSATYYIKPKIGAPYACYAKPNLTNGTGSFAGPASQWDPAKGFKLQNLGTPSSNFPTTGTNGLSFELTIAGTTAQSVIDTIGATVQGSPATTVSLALSVSSPNVLKVTLQGPIYPSGGAFSPTTFKLKSGTTEIYNFRIGKWFIAKRVKKVNYSTVQTFCNNAGYQIPTRADFTNSLGNVALAATSPSDYLVKCPGTGSDDTIAGTNNGQYCKGGTYTRAIGGGLYAEWGPINISTIWHGNAYYWTSDAWNNASNYKVNNASGAIAYALRNSSDRDVACVNL